MSRARLLRSPPFNHTRIRAVASFPAGEPAHGVEIPAAAKVPDLIVHDTHRNRLLLIKAEISAGQPV